MGLSCRPWGKNKSFFVKALRKPKDDNSKKKESK